MPQKDSGNKVIFRRRSSAYVTVIRCVGERTREKRQKKRQQCQLAGLCKSSLLRVCPQLFFLKMKHFLMLMSATTKCAQECT